MCGLDRTPRSSRHFVAPHIHVFWRSCVECRHDWTWLVFQVGPCKHIQPPHVTNFLSNQRMVSPVLTTVSSCDPFNEEYVSMHRRHKLASVRFHGQVTWQVLQWYSMICSCSKETEDMLPLWIEVQPQCSNFMVNGLLLRNLFARLFALQRVCLRCLMERVLAIWCEVGELFSGWWAGLICSCICVVWWVEQACCVTCVPSGSASNGKRKRGFSVLPKVRVWCRCVVCRQFASCVWVWSYDDEFVATMKQRWLTMMS